MQHLLQPTCPTHGSRSPCCLTTKDRPAGCCCRLAFSWSRSNCRLSNCTPQSTMHAACSLPRMGGGGADVQGPSLPDKWPFCSALTCHARISPPALVAHACCTCCCPKQAHTLSAISFLLFLSDFPLPSLPPPRSTLPPMVGPPALKGAAWAAKGLISHTFRTWCCNTTPLTEHD